MNQDFIEALRALEKEKGINKDVLIEAIETALVTAYKRDYSQDADVRVTVNRDSGKMQVFRRWNIVEEIENEDYETTLEQAHVFNPSYEIGDVLEREVTPKSFGRIAAQTAKQIVVQRIREEERSGIYDKYADSQDEVVTAIVKRVEKFGIRLEIGKDEAFLAAQEMMPGETLKSGDYVKVYMLEVRRAATGPQILVSRTHPGLVKRLFEMEVPEIRNGVVQIHSVAREAGYRTKMAVSSVQGDIDPVGSCVGQRGARVERIVGELKGEKIDIVRWSEDPAQFIANALSPAKVLTVWADTEQKMARVLVPDTQLSLAIGREGQNARLAAKLTGWKIDIKSQSQMDDHAVPFEMPELSPMPLDIADDYEDDVVFEDYDL